MEGSRKFLNNGLNNGYSLFEIVIDVFVEGGELTRGKTINGAVRGELIWSSRKVNVGGVSLQLVPKAHQQSQHNLEE